MELKSWGVEIARCETPRQCCLCLVCWLMWSSKASGWQLAWSYASSMVAHAKASTEQSARRSVYVRFGKLCGMPC